MAHLSSSIAFTARRSEPELVVPSMPTPHELKQLSDIDDQQALRAHVIAITFFKNNPLMEGQDVAKLLKQAIGRALVHYYPLAGRLVEGFNKKLSVDCSGQGLLFIEASADITLNQLGHTIISPYPYLDEILYNVPGSDGVLGCPLLLVQATRLLCGGFILALRVNHTVCDGVGMAQFMMAIAEMVAGADVPSILPVWRRELLNAREPPRVTCEHHEYEEKALNFVPISDDVLQRSFLISSDFMEGMRKDLPEQHAKCTSYELLTGCLWKCVALALNLDHEEPLYVSVVVNARDKKYNANIPLGFYGNAIAFPAAVSKSKHLCEKPLEYAVELVKEAKARMSAEYIHSVADFMAMRGRPPFRSKGFLLVSDIRFLGEKDIGCGLPAYVGLVVKLPWICHLSKYKNSEGHESVVASISLPRPVMESFEKELEKMKAKIKSNA